MAVDEWLRPRLKDGVGGRGLSMYRGAYSARWPPTAWQVGSRSGYFLRRVGREQWGSSGQGAFQRSNFCRF